MKIKYITQLWISVGIVLLFNVLTTLCKHWIFHSIGFCLAGLLWILNPVMAGNRAPTKKERAIIRASGAVVILLGIFSRAYYY